MTGISEILVLVLLIAGILILPRLFKNEPAQARDKASPIKKIKNLSVKARASILITLMYPCAIAVVIQPWESNLHWYILFGIAPVILAWSIVWILEGRKTK